MPPTGRRDGLQHVPVGVPVEVRQAEQRPLGGDATVAQRLLRVGELGGDRFGGQLGEPPVRVAVEPDRHPGLGERSDLGVGRPVGDPAALHEQRGRHPGTHHRVDHRTEVARLARMVARLHVDCQRHLHCPSGYRPRRMPLMGHTRRGPLAGVTVVETATYMSGPYAGMMLADLGADVIKVEGERGDPFRNYGRPETEYSAVFANCNRSKRSVVLDLKDPDGRDELLALLARADVFLANWRAGVAESLRLSDDLLESTNPRLVRCFITGFGPTGPRAAEPAFDTVLQGLSGLSDALDTGDEPKLIPGYPLDKVAATMAVQTILASLLQRERTGRGERIELPMLDVATYFDFADLFTGRVFVDHQPDVAQNAQASAIRPIRTADGWIVVAPVTARQIAAACPRDRVSRVDRQDPRRA